MALPTTPANSWMQGLDFPSQLFEFGSTDYELYEEGDEFVLTIEMPGFDPADIEVTWNEGVLNVAGEHENEARNRRKTYHRRFRVPKEIEDDDISARYNNGVLEVHLPIPDDAVTRGTRIPVES